MDESDRRRKGGIDRLDVGSDAPDFTLRWGFERSINLRDTLQSGSVLLAFYVFDFGRY